MVFALLLGFATPGFGQQDKIAAFVHFVDDKVRQANALMAAKQVKAAIEMLNEANRYLESSVNFDLEDQLFAGRRENPAFAFDFRETVAAGFSSGYWQRKYDLAGRSLDSGREAFSGMSCLRVLDRGLARMTDLSRFSPFSPFCRARQTSSWRMDLGIESEAVATSSRYAGTARCAP